MKFRQVHLDFHTSEKLENIGEDFNKKEFCRALRAGHVNSITLFSKCHHGWSYHPTKVNEIHPHLDFDLLGAQIEAAHEAGVRAVVYISAGLDEKYAVAHRGQVIRKSDESTIWATDFMQPNYHRLCMNTPYLDFLLAQIKEMLENYDADGLFLDIAAVETCYCESCMNTLIGEGKDPENLREVTALAEHVYENYTRRVREVVDSVRPGLPVFHNGGHIRIGRRDLAYANSHLELESLPTGGWGYDHFPVTAAYARTLGMEYLGMTGKFHTTWGEFGGFKHPNALRYEVSLAAACGAASSIGDQMPPNGRLDPATYELIGAAYSELEEKEEYLEGAKNISDIGVFGLEALENSGEDAIVSEAKVRECDAGCARILLEGKYLFDYIDIDEDFAKYKLIILPDRIRVNARLREKLAEYAARGGKILASGISATDGDGSFVVDLGAENICANEFKPSYCRPKFEISSLGNSAYVVYADAYKLGGVTGEVAAERENPYFNRTREHFCSHQHAPANPDSAQPAVVIGKCGAYIGWDIFEEYEAVGSLCVKEIVCGVIDRLLTEKSLVTNLPAQGVATLTEQSGRKIVHLLYASPVRRGKAIEVIEDILPVYGTHVALRCDSAPKRVYLAPQNVDIPFDWRNGYAHFDVDKFECHQMIAVQ